MDIFPICNKEYFEEDIVTRFVESIRVIYGISTFGDLLFVH